MCGLRGFSGPRERRHAGVADCDARTHHLACLDEWVLTHLGRKYDALGDGTKSKYFNLDDFTESIDWHLLKGNDFTVIDMTGYTADQIGAVRQYVDALAPAKQAIIRRVGF
jgi:hypothetical protein